MKLMSKENFNNKIEKMMKLGKSLSNQIDESREKESLLKLNGECRERFLEK